MSGNRLRVVRTDESLRALEAVRAVAAEYGLDPAQVKPCIAVLLDGNIGGAARHDAAFVIAIECRRLKLNEAETGRVLAMWAKKIGYQQSQTRSAISSAFAKKAAGTWKYHPPGVNKKPGSKYDQVLGATCADVGCPANCGPFAHVHRGPPGEGMEAFERLGWPAYFRKTRHVAAIDFYEAIVQLEQRRGFAAGSPLLTSFKQLAGLAGRDHSHAGENLRILFTKGLLARYEKGSGSGPRAADRKPSLLQRQVPVPPTPASHRGAITTGGGSPHQIGGLS